MTEAKCMDSYKTQLMFGHRGSIRK